MKKHAIVTDFDGTVTTVDIGNSIAVHTGSSTHEEIENDYKNNADPKSWMDRHFGSLKMTPEEFEKLVLSYAKIKAGFVELAAYAKENQIPFEITSGGLDIYIYPVLKKADLTYIPVYSARGTFKEDGILIDFPHFKDLPLDEFKAARVKHYKDKGRHVIYLGDGISDFLAAKEADTVFAVGHLERLCKKNNIQYYEFKDFNTALKIVRGDYVSISA
jgi:2-hydroxy-3-keto-5-methylthiopentenyl-1-phosphate phosphatase